MLTINHRVGVFLIGAMIAGSVAAAETIRVTEPWVRATTAPQTTTGAYMTILSTVPAKLVAASSPIAQTIQFHMMSMSGGVMRMRALDEVGIKANVPAQFSPGGLHVMLSGLKQPIKAGTRVPISLTFVVKGKKQTVNVEAPAALGEPHAHH